MYRSTSSACALQKMKISCTPPAARNSIVYSSIGTFASGISTLGIVHVTGRKFFANESASTTACSTSRCSRSWSSAPLALGMVSASKVEEEELRRRGDEEERGGAPRSQLAFCHGISVVAVDSSRAPPPAS